MSNDSAPKAPDRTTLESQSEPAVSDGLAPKTQSQAMLEGEGEASASYGPVPKAPTRAMVKVRFVAIVCLFLVGAAIMLYPAYSYLYYEYLSSRIAVEYQQTVEAMNPDERARLLEDAQAYNKVHTMNVIADPFGDDGASKPESAEYMRQLAVPGQRAMAYLDIPKIGQRLPVYHGTSEEVLNRGVGHLSGTSLPVGGDSTHCVLSAHRGLASKKLFTDLDQVAKGDEFYLHVLGEDLAYRVDHVVVVEPNQVSGLAIQPGKDLCTLVTCTPYAVNTHRLLVTGHRVPYVAPQDDGPLTNQLALFSPQSLALAAAFTVIVILAFSVLMRRLKKNRTP